MREILHRLFNEDDLRLFEPSPVYFRCRCSRERVAGMLQGLGEAETRSVLAERGEVEVRCDFCNRAYVFDAVDVAQLFNAGCRERQWQLGALSRRASRKDIERGGPDLSHFAGAVIAFTWAAAGDRALAEAPFYANTFEKVPSAAAMTALGRALFFDPSSVGFGQNGLRGLPRSEAGLRAGQRIARATRRRATGAAPACAPFHR